MLKSHSSAIARRSLQSACPSQVPSRKGRVLHDASARVNMTQTLKPSLLKKRINENEEPKLNIQRLGDEDDPQDAFAFDLEVFNTMKKEENDSLPDSNLFDLQSTIKPKMRSNVLDWLVEVHCKLGFHTDTLYLTANIMDRYLSKCDVDKSNYQRVGCAAILIAAKNLELCPPTLKDLVKLADKSFTKLDLSRMESNIMEALDYKINPFVSSMFLKRFLRIMQPDFYLSMVAHYILESTILDQQFIGITPSKLAAATVCLAATLYRGEGQWTHFIETNTGYSVHDLTDTVQDLLNCVNSAVTSRFTAIRRKYARKDMDCVSNIKYPESIRLI